MATFVLDRVDWFLYGLEPDEVHDRTWAARPEHKDPAHVVASRASEALGGDPIPQNHIAGHLVHYAIGIAPVMAYAVLRDRVPAVTAGYGLGFGLAMEIVEDQVTNPGSWLCRATPALPLADTHPGPDIASDLRLGR